VQRKGISYYSNELSVLVPALAGSTSTAAALQLMQLCLGKLLRV